MRDCESETIFLLGMPRSGTTWLAKKIDEHPDILYRHEPDIALREPGLPSYVLGELATTQISLAQRYITRLESCEHVRAVGPPPYFPKRFRSGLVQKCYPATARATRIAHHALCSISIDVALRVPLPRRHRTRQIILIKSVGSLGRLPVFRASRPSARFIQLVRHPCGYVNSRLRGAQLNMTTLDNIPVGFIHDACDYLNVPVARASFESLSVEEKLTLLWGVQNELAFLSSNTLEHYHLAIYDDLALNPEKELEKIFAFLSLEQSSISTQARGKAIYSDSYFSIDRDSAKSANAWRQRLKIDQIQLIEKTASYFQVFRVFE